MAEFLNLDNTKATYISADQQNQIRVTNQTNTTLYYDDTNAVGVSTNDGNLTQGQSASFTTGFYLRPIAQCQVVVEHFVESRVADVIASDDLTVGDDATVADTLAVTGATTLTGGVTTTTPKTRYANHDISVSTEGTNTTPSITVAYVSQIFIPVNCTLTGAALFNGTDVTDKVILALFNSAGVAQATTALAGTAGSGTDAWQQVAFTATKAVTGPNSYWVGAYFNGTTTRFNTLAAINADCGLAGSITTQTFGTVANITPPTTFTADLGPICFVY